MDDVPWSYAAPSSCGSTLSVTPQDMSSVKQRAQELCMKDSTCAGDATYLDIFREFSHMASNNPEKLKRRSLHFSHSCR